MRHEVVFFDLVKADKGDDAVKAPQKLQSPWFDNTTHAPPSNSMLQRYFAELSITGLTSNQTIFDHPVAISHSYDDEIRRLVASGRSGQAQFFELANAADLFAPIHQRTSPDGARRRRFGTGADKHQPSRHRCRDAGQTVTRRGRQGLCRPLVRPSEVEAKSEALA